MGLVLVIGYFWGMRDQLEGQSGTVLCGTGTGYWWQQGEWDSSERDRTERYCVGLVLVFGGRSELIQQ